MAMSVLENEWKDEMRHHQAAEEEPDDGYQ